MSSSSSSLSLASGPETSLSSDTRRFGIRLSRQPQSRYVVGYTDAFRMTVTAYDGRGLPDEIFRFLRGPGRAIGSEDDVFDGVCSPVDLEEFPVGEPGSDQAIKYFRKASIDLAFRSETQANEAWRTIYDEVESLIRSLEYMENLGPAEIVAIGNPQDGSSSSSSAG